jgi:outer membrane protein assembly factor BamD
MRRRIPAAGLLVWCLAVAVVVTAAGCGGSRISVPRTSDRFEFESGKVAYGKKHWLDAQKHLKRFLDLHPGHAAADSAQWLLGMSQFQVKSYAEAAVEFAILVREFPRSDLRDEASLQECLCYREQMSETSRDPTFAFRTRSCIDEFVLRYPDSPLRDAARGELQDIANGLAEKDFVLGMMWTKMKRHRAAIIYFDEVLQKYPNSIWVPESLFWKARCLQERQQDDEAIKLLRLLVQSFPDHKVTAAAQNELEHLERAAARRQP